MPTTTRGYVYPDDTAAPDVPADMLALAASIDSDVQDIADELDAAWTTFVPAITATSFSLGNGTLAGRQKTQGKTKKFHLQFTIGSTTNVGTSSNWLISLPTTPAVGTSPGRVFKAIAFDSSAGAYYVLPCVFDNANRVKLFNQGTANGVPGSGNTVPFAWATGDYLIVDGEYELA